MKFITEEGKLIIELEGLEIFFGMRRKLVVPKKNIQNLEWLPSYSFTGRLWKVVGSGVSRVLYAGSFRGQGIRYYLYLRSPVQGSWISPINSENILVIKTTDFRFQQIVISLARDAADPVISWWKR